MPQSMYRGMATVWLVAYLRCLRDYFPIQSCSWTPGLPELHTRSFFKSIRFVFFLKCPHAVFSWGELGWSLMLFIITKLSLYFSTLFSCDFISFVNRWALLLLLFLQDSQVPAIWLLSLPHHTGAVSNHSPCLGTFIHSIIRSILSYSWPDSLTI